MSQAMTFDDVQASAQVQRPVRKWWVALAVALGALLEVVDTSIVNVALNDIQTTVGATLSEASWIVSSYAVANVIVLPMTAWLGARFGKKRYFVFSLIGFTLASVLCGLATSLPMLIIARVLQGLMGGGLLAKAQAFLFETFPKEEQALAQGFFGAVVIAGPAIGPTLGGFIVTNYDWRWIFLVNVPVGIAAVFLCLAALPEDTGKADASRIDWLAIALLATGLGSLQTVLEEGNSDDWFDSHLITFLACTAVFGLVAFVWRELTSDKPIVNLRVLRHRSLWAGSLLSVVVGMALYGALFAIPIFAQTIMNYTPEQTGWLLFPGALVAAFSMPLVARLLGKFDARMVLAGGGLVLISALFSFTNLSPQTGSSDLFWPLIVRSVGTTMMFLPLNLATMGPIPKQEVGEAAAFFNLTRQLGGSIGVALLTTLLTNRQAFHRAVLVEKLVPSDPGVLARLDTLTQMFVSKGADLAQAQQRALSMLDGTVNQQAAVMSFGDTFWAVGMLVLLCLPLVLLLGKANRGAPMDAGH
ncbi:MAG: DHA2 family efflux MFS transporter permease subunit [Myxococcales bacterium]